MSFTTLATLLLIALPGRADLTGTVRSTDGEQISGAFVVIDTAAVKKGTSSLCPSCYPDCNKRAETVADGSFTIRGLDADLTFQVLVIAEGYRSKPVKPVDPAKGPIEVTLDRLDLASLDPKCILRGVVVDPEGNPVVGATLEPRMFKTDAYHGYAPDILDPLVVTNQSGEFVMTSKSPISYVDLKVKGRGLAPRIFEKRLIEEGPHRLQMTRGADVTGRVMLGRKPLDDVVVGLVQVDRGMGAFLGAVQIGTDRNGRFLFSNVAPNQHYYLYGIMSSFGERGAVAARPIEVGGDGSTLDVGDVAVGPAHKLAGTVILSDKKPVPPGTRIMVDREQAWDDQEAVLDSESRFAVVGLPAERYSIYVNLKSYSLSKKNKATDPNHPGSLMGMVDQDVLGLKILMEPGERR